MDADGIAVLSRLVCRLVLEISDSDQVRRGHATPQIHRGQQVSLQASSLVRGADLGYGDTCKGSAKALSARQNALPCRVGAQLSSKFHMYTYRSLSARAVRTSDNDALVL